MNYTTLGLAALALVGVLLNNLVNINAINQDPNKGNFTLKSYLAKEWASVSISIILGVVCAILKSEIKMIQWIEDYIGFAFVAIGYLAQYVLVALMGKAKKTIDNNIN